MNITSCVYLNPVSIILNLIIYTFQTTKLFHSNTRKHNVAANDIVFPIVQLYYDTHITAVDSSGNNMFCNNEPNQQ